jgi:hypothetical protein
MPRMGVATCIRASFDRATRAASTALERALSYMRSRGINVSDLLGERATRSNAIADINSRDPLFILGEGHGSPSNFSGHNKEIIFQVCNCSELKDRVVYLLSCEAGAQLGPDTIRKGARAFIGYKKPFVWIMATTGDPLADPYGKGAFEPVLELIYKLADGRIAGEAYNASMDKWNQWIDHWSRSTDPTAPLVLQTLINNRDCQVLLGDQNATIAAPAPAIPVPIPAPAIQVPLSMILGLVPIAAVAAVIAGNELGRISF